jgi:hypothetical protein
MIPAFISASPGGITIPIIDLPITPLAEPYSFAPIVVAVWMVVGIVIGVLLWLMRREALGTVADAMGESDGAPPSGEQPMATPA